ncbi:disease resistance-like protein DSC1 isoform X2 [Rosa rugosa]|uniref:disease resistance-like protein DSC1 isoform X2 n=1 Tax=Rosa rugosa TaxID=74645 RepID=UPI002B406C09|nr:disease resistance-like protein DSC1 isoform X2 [Rosa rugosa]
MSSSSSPRDVFLNFRGDDTRDHFVCHLHKALKGQAVKAYLDNLDLKKGEDLSKILNAIAESKISIVVFSQNYATSTWCLEELVEILECRKKQKHIVMPVFYRVDPSDICEQTGSFAAAFSNHERDRKEGENSCSKVKRWRSALKEAGEIAGWDSKIYEDDAKLIDAIVERVFNALRPMRSSSKNNHLVGMDSRIENMRLGLPLQMDEVRKVGIWGMGGIGKTTIATEVYDRYRSQFDHCCLLDRVKERFQNGGVSMLKDILCSLLEREVRVDTLNEGYNIMEGLSESKVLVVLDDVDKRSQINPLLGLDGRPSFGVGSRIIVTTRQKDILSGFEIYKAELLSDADALKLFSLNAFETNTPLKEYDDLSGRAVEYAQGLPLALEILGSLLHNKGASEWKEELDKLKEMPNTNIQNVLRTSFDGLDKFQKKIFLDIACFFRGMARDYVTKVFDSCVFFPESGIQVLVRRALVTISKSDGLEMHDLLLEMGREIAKEDVKRSRFWGEDAERLLTENTATENVEGLMIDLSNKEHKFFRSEAFVRMKKLRLLIFTYWQWYAGDDGENHLDEDLKFLSSELRVLVWHRYPLKWLPSNFDPKNLVHLDMGCSNIEQLWEASKPARKLIRINLSRSPNLKRTPDLTQATNLEELHLDGCSSLTDVHPSILALPNLVSLSLCSCHELKSLPSSIHMKSLKTLSLYSCTNLEMFPEISEDMGALSELNLNATAIKELPRSIERLRGLKKLNMSNCRSLTRLPDSICNLAKLESLCLFSCSELRNLPDKIGNLESLLELNVDDSGLEQLPVSILRLKHCQLSFAFCRQMAAPLSSWPSSIEDRCTVVVHLDLRDCNMMELSDAIAYFPSLKVLWLSRNNLESLPAVMNGLASLEQLELEGCKRLRSIPELSSTISYINAHDCTALESVSTPQSPYDIGRCFKFSNCIQLVQKDVFRDMVETHFPPQGNCSRPFYVSLPGSEIPEWFTHQCRGSSVTAKLPPNWFDNKFLGFTICAVTNKPEEMIASNVSDPHRSFTLTARCFCTFKGDLCEYRFSFYLFEVHSGGSEWFESNHMLMGYVPWSEFGMIKREEVNERRYKEAKFEIQLQYSSNRLGHCIGEFYPSIERCGVRFAFANNEEDSREPMVEVDNSERRLEECLAESCGSDITCDTSDEDEQSLKLLSEVFKGANRSPSYIEIEDNDSSKKRITLKSWTQKVRVTSGLRQGHLDDGFNWYRGYINSEREEYNCRHDNWMHRQVDGCLAQAIVPTPIDPTILEITYDGRHTCWKFQPMLTHQVSVTPGMGTEPPLDGFTWGEYDQTDIPGAKYPRVYYYVCTPQNVKGCMAIKEVQHSSDKKILKITYRGRHTCIEASDSSSISAGSDASSIHEQVVQSSSSPGANDHGGNEIRVADNPVDEDNVIVSRDASPQDMSNRKEVAAKKSKGEEVAELEVEMTEKKKKKKDKDNDVLDSSDGEKSVKVKKHRDKEEAGSPQTKKSEKKKKKRNKEAEDHGADAATDNGKGDGEADKSERKKNEKKKHKQQEITDSPVPVPAKKSKGEEVAELEVEKTEKKKKKKKKDKDVGVLDFSDGEKSLKVKKHKDNEEAGSPQTEKSEKKKKKRNKEAEYHGADAATDNGKGDGEADKSEKKKNEKKKRKEEEITDSAVTVPAKKSKGEEVAELEVEKTEKKKKKKKKDKHNGVLDSSDGEKSVKVKKHKDKEEAGSPQSEKSEKKKNKEAEDHGADAATDNGKGDCEAYKSEKKKNEKKKRKQEEITDSAVTVPAKKSKSEEVAELEVEKTEKKKKMKKKKKDKDNGVLDSSDGEISVKVKKHKDKEEAGSPQTEKSEKKKKKRNKEAEDHGADAATNNGKGDGEADKSEKKKKKKKDKSDADEE